MTANRSTTEILLNGLDGGNPLGFLAAIGTAIVLKDVYPGIRLGWKQKNGAWRPSLSDCDSDEQKFSKNLLKSLKNTSMSIFDIDNKMPFDTNKFSRALRDIRSYSSIINRRDADFLSSFGIELYPNTKTKENTFQDSKFRMVRSGDSAGQGLPFYAKEMRKKIDENHIHRTLFHIWDYQDKGYSLRWDPLEDQRYALRWHDPSLGKSKQGTMWAANSLAIEALQYFPVMLVGKQAKTTGFQRFGRRETYFVWPIWTPMLGIEAVRSLLSIGDIHKYPVPRSSLAKRGVEEIYRSQRIQQNQYYNNFLVAVPA